MAIGRRMLVEVLRSRDFETTPSLLKATYYSVERSTGHLLFRKRPPQTDGPKLLNLGCGPMKYAGWCNADDFAFKRWFREKHFRPDWRLDITKPWRCGDDHWDGIFSQHVIEHLQYSLAVFVMEECFRTLKYGAWLRVCVPSLSKYIAFYTGREDSQEFARFPSRALAISFMAQMHYHKSIWDEALITAVLREIGFSQVRVVQFGEGTDKAIIQDQAGKAWESLYVEAQKPL